MNLGFSSKGEVAGKLDAYCPHNEELQRAGNGKEDMAVTRSFGDIRDSTRFSSSQPGSGLGQRWRPRCICGVEADQPLKLGLN